MRRLAMVTCVIALSACATEHHYRGPYQRKTAAPPTAPAALDGDEIACVDGVMRRPDPNCRTLVEENGRVVASGGACAPKGKLAGVPTGSLDPVSRAFATSACGAFDKLANCLVGRDAKGTVELVVAIDEAGNVARVVDTNGTLPDTAAVGCVLTVFSSLKSSPGAGVLTYVVTIGEGRDEQPAREIRVREGSITVATSDLNPLAIKQAIRDAHPALRTCYLREAVFRGTPVGGTFHARFEIDGEGRAQRITVRVPKGFEDARLCMEMALERVAFPKGGSAEVDYPFRMRGE